MKKEKLLHQANLIRVLNPSGVEVIALLEHYQAGRFYLAENLAKEIAFKYPDHHFSWKLLGAIYKQTGRLQDSLTVDLRAVEILPNDPEALCNLGITLQLLGRLEEAETSYRKAIAVKSDYAEAYGNLGNTQQELGRLEEAETSYKKAISINPKSAEVHYNLGNALLDLGRLEEAEASYKKAIEIKSDYAEAYSNLGITLQELSRLEEAETSYKKAIAINPESAEPYYNFGNLLKEQGKIEESNISYKKAITINSSFAEALYNLGITEQELGRLEEAVNSYKKAISIRLDYAEAYGNLGITLQELSRLEEAETSYKKAIAINPESAEANYNLGLMLLETERYEQASKTLKLSNFKNSQSYLLKCLYLTNDKLQFSNLLDTLNNEGKTDSIIGSLCCRAELKYGLIKQNSFCKDPLRYVLKVDLSKSYDFPNTFINPITTILNSSNTRLKKLQKLLIKGRQTLGNLFKREPNSTIKIEKIIRNEIEKYRNYFKDSQEGFIKKWPIKYRISGWLICMKSGGELRPHMHENGWVSGSIYINVPPKSNINNGNLVVCINDDDYLLEGKASNKKIIDVTTGVLCLFPASLLHYTIPFESKEERIVLAFDILAE
jgi:tetratricopeptide (TPR) repeat protein